MRPRVTHPLARMLLYGVLASAVGVAIVLAIDWFPAAATEDARTIDTLYDVLLVVSVPIFVLVMTVAIYSVRTFRARPGDTRDGEPIHGNTRLEVVWVTIPFLIVSTLAAYGWIVLDDIESKEPDAMTVGVRGEQFTWTFEYPEAGRKPTRTTELVLPRGRQVHFKIRARDVIHSFWVPAFRLKEDAVPGITTTYRAKPDRLGRYDVVCAELCGLGHSTMRNLVRVVPPAEFDRWLAGERRQGGGDG